VGYEGTIPDINGFILRLEENGDFATDFGSTGYVLSDIGTTTSVYTIRIHILEDHSILATGYLLQNHVSQVYALLVTDKGKPHSKFGTGGDVNYSFPIETSGMSVRESSIDADGNIILTGNYIQKGGGPNTIFIVRLTGPDMSIQTSSIDDPISQLALYPNPANHQFFIDTRGVEIEEVHLYNT
jgi:hypothetical protein